MDRILSFRDLDVWQLGMDLIVDVYEATKAFPDAERYGLTSQMRRAAVSVPANVAEGHASRSDGVYLHHVRIALGSQAELLTEIEAARRLGFLTEEGANSLTASIDRVRQLLHGVRKSLERRRRVSLSTGVLLLLLSTTSLLQLM